MITMQAVKSSTIRAIGYDGADRTLRVEFNSGGLYNYKDVPRASYDAMMAAESVGKFFAANIKPHFKFERIEKEPA